MAEYKLVFCDLDGTLLNSKHVIPESAKRAVALLVQRKIPFILASGRTPLGIEGLQDELGVDAPYVASNGGYVGFKDGRCLASTGFDRDFVIRFQQQAQDFLPDAQCAAYYGRDWIVDDGDTDAALLEGRLTNTRPLTGTLENIVPPADMLQKMLYIDPKDRLPELAERMTALYPELGIFVSNENMMEVLPAGVTKAWGAAEICRYFDISPDQTVAFGDGVNDLGLFHFCGLSVAMGQSPEMVKNSADMVTQGNDDDGLARALNTLFDLNMAFS